MANLIVSTIIIISFTLVGVLLYIFIRPENDYVFIMKMIGVFLCFFLVGAFFQMLPEGKSLKSLSNNKDKIEKNL